MFDPHKTMQDRQDWHHYLHFTDKDALRVSELPKGHPRYDKHCRRKKIRSSDAWVNLFNYFTEMLLKQSSRQRGEAGKMTEGIGYLQQPDGATAAGQPAALLPPPPQSVWKVASST